MNWQMLGLMVLASVWLVGCGGGGDNSGSDGGSTDEEIHISEQGFVDQGIFVGDLDGTEVLLVIQGSNYYLLAGEFVSAGNYTVESIEFRASGVAYDVTEDDQVTGNTTLSGTYQTDRHINLSWLEPATGAERSLVVEASDLYFENSPLENVLGAWINQDEGNLTFFNVSENLSPIAGDDFVPVEPGVETVIDVLANDRDDDGDNFFVTSVDNTSTGGGTVALFDNGTPDDPLDDQVLYLSPDGLTSGTDTFSYEIEDELEGGDNADVTITLPIRDTDVSLDVSVSNEAPLAEERVTVSVTMTNNGVVPVQVQSLILLPSGLSYRDDDGEGSFENSTGFWATSVGAGASETLTIDTVVATFGEFELSASISSVDAIDADDSDNADSVTLVPGNLDSDPPAVPRVAQIEGVILSSLTQIGGTITEAGTGFNAYPIVLRLGAGGLASGGDTDPFIGFVVISEELVEIEPEEGDEGAETTTELRETMLVLTSNPSGVYLNKLFFISEEELSEGE